MNNQTKIVIAIVGMVIVVGLSYIFYFYPKQQPVQEKRGLSPTTITQEVTEGQAVLLDVRTNLELEQDGYAVGSTHFDLARLQNGELPEIEKDIKIYIYCRAGTRAGKAEEILEENGFANLKNIGGLVDWINAGGETNK